jgi:hypothetical protein
MIPQPCVHNTFITERQFSVKKKKGKKERLLLAWIFSQFGYLAPSLLVLDSFPKLIH